MSFKLKIILIIYELNLKYLLMKLILVSEQNKEVVGFTKMFFSFKHYFLVALNILGTLVDGFFNIYSNLFSAKSIL